MAICGCGLPAHCCQPAVAGGIFYADLWGELSTHLAWQALFTQSSPVHEPLLQAFLFPCTLGEVILHLLSLACVFVYSSHRKWVSPPLLWSFPPTAAFTSFAAPDCWAVLLLLPAGVFVYSSHGRWVFPLSCGVFLPLPLSQPGNAPHSHRSLSSQAQLVYLQLQEGDPSPLFGVQCTPSSLPGVFIVLIAYYSVSLFSPCGSQSVQGLC
jgi:hypothetical protein